jgi:hypothetical protein
LCFSTMHDTNWGFSSLLCLVVDLEGKVVCMCMCVHMCLCRLLKVYSCFLRACWTDEIHSFILKKKYAGFNTFSLCICVCVCLHVGLGIKSRASCLHC